MKRIFTLCAVIIAVYIACGGQTGREHFVKVQKGRFSSTITETGELKAVNSMVIGAPFIKGIYEYPQIIDLKKEGIQVEKGQIVGELEKAKIIQVLEQKRSDLDIARSNMEKLKVEHENTIKKLNAELLTVKADLSSVQIEAQRAEFESESKKERAKLNLKKAEINFKKAERKIETTKIVNSEDLKIQQIKIMKLISEIQLAERALNEYTLRAPIDGMIVYCINWRTGKKVQIGEQMYPMMPIIALPDLSQMKVLTSINEMDISKVSIEQKVYVRLDAFPKKVFKGVVIKLSNTTRVKERKSKIKVFDVEVLLDKVDRILKPGMTVSCDFVIAELDDVLFVDNDCIHQEGKEYFVYIDRGHGLQRTKITLGPRNNKTAVVSGDIKAGDRVVVMQKSEEA